MKLSNNYIGFIILILSFLSCESKDVNGHYHVTNINFPDRAYFTIDIINDTLTSIGKNSSYEEVFGYHNKKEEVLNLPGDCGSGYLKYETIKNGLLFTGSVLGDKYIGLRCDSTCCSAIEDFFIESQLDIKLPIIPNDLDNIYGEFNKRFCSNIFIGKSKQIYDKTTKMSLEGSFAEISDIELWVEKCKIRFSEDQRNRMNFVIYADSETEINLISKVVAELRKIKVNRILLAYLKKKQSRETSPFKIVNVNELELYKKE